MSDLYTQRLVEFASNQKSGSQNVSSNPDIDDPVVKSGTAQSEILPSSQMPATQSNSLCKGPIRTRDKSHLKFVANQACLICERKPTQAHHLKHAQLRAMGRKPGDQWTVPLCAIHHRKLHDHGNEATWWLSNNIDQLKIAKSLWHQQDN